MPVYLIIFFMNNITEQQIQEYVKFLDDYDNFLRGKPNIHLTDDYTKDLYLINSCYRPCAIFYDYLNRYTIYWNWIKTDTTMPFVRMPMSTDFIFLYLEQI